MDIADVTFLSSLNGRSNNFVWSLVSKCRLSSSTMTSIPLMEILSTSSVWISMGLKLISFETINFELDKTEQTNVILQILKYAGIIIEDPQIIESAAQQVAVNEQNEKI